MRALLIGFFAAMSVGSATADGLEPGLYEITYRLELPHLERYALPRHSQNCISANAPIPIMSGNGAFNACDQRDRIETKTSLKYRLICLGRSGARASAKYTIDSTGFNGRIAVKLGAKNMTLTEIQSGRRLGACETVRAELD